MEEKLISPEPLATEEGEFDGEQASLSEAFGDEGGATETEITDEGYIEQEHQDTEDARLSLDSDLDELREEFPELAARESVSELDNPTRYAALRELGLTPREAYLATAKRAPRTDSRSHLSDSFHGTKAAPISQMTRGELLTARELFSDLNDGQIHELYKRVK